LPKELSAIAREIVAHFQLYFIRNTNPQIVIRNQNNIEFNLDTLFKTEFKSDVKSGKFNIGDTDFELFCIALFRFAGFFMAFFGFGSRVKLLFAAVNSTLGTPLV
jgi:hypothetical protein